MGADIEINDVWAVTGRVYIRYKERKSCKNVIKNPKSQKILKNTCNLKNSVI